MDEVYAQWFFILVTIPVVVQHWTHGQQDFCQFIRLLFAILSCSSESDRSLLQESARSLFAHLQTHSVFREYLNTPKATQLKEVIDIDLFYFGCVRLISGIWIERGQQLTKKVQIKSVEL
eukprot:725316_1